MARTKTTKLEAKRLDKTAAAHVRCAMGFTNVTYYDDGEIQVQFFIYGCTKYEVTLEGSASDAYYDPKTQIIVLRGVPEGTVVTLNIRCSDGVCNSASSITFEN